MPECKKKNNRSESESESEDLRGYATYADRMYHNSESFLYRYRWWVILVLICLLSYYLYARKSADGASSRITGNTNVQPKLSNELNIASPGANNLDTVVKKLFKLL